MSESKFEDILKEARNSARSPKHRKTNRILAIIFAILSILNFLSMTYAEYISGENFSESLGGNLLLTYFLFPTIIVLPSLFFSIFSYKGWKFDEKLLRLFLILNILLYALIITATTSVWIDS